MELNEPAVAYQKQRYSIEEYLEKELESEEKHEYYNGEIFAMAGATLQHNIVSKNILSSLDQMLHGHACQPFNSETRVHIEKNSLFTYPDISVICSDPITRNNDDMNVLNPTVIFEVLSPSTRSYDQVEKFDMYKSIPSLKEYVLVEPETISVEVYFLAPGGEWERTTHSSIEDQLVLRSIGASLQLKNIYRNTEISKA